MERDSEIVPNGIVASRNPLTTATEFLAELPSVLELVKAEALDRVIALLLQAQSDGRRVYIIGNGGSAATASHLVCDLTKTAFRAGRRPLRAFALTDSTPLLTAWANDTAYARVFAGQLATLLDPGDVVIAISASGKSPNIVDGLTAATECGARTIGLLGFDGGLALPLVDVAIHVPCSDYGLVEAAHLAICQAIAVAIRQVTEPANARGRLARA